MTSHPPFYDPAKSYQENYEKGPFGEFANQIQVTPKKFEQYDFLGLKINTPIGIPAGPMPTSRFIAAAFRKGFAVNVYKTVRSREYPCHPWPNVLAVHPNGNLQPGMTEGLVADDQYTPPLSITNSFGVPSMSPEVWQPDMKKAVEAAGAGQVLVGSFQGTSSGEGLDTYIQDFVNAARLVKETGAKILEVNFSCPNEGTAHLLCFDIDRSKQIVEAIKNEIGNTPLIVKIAYYSDQDQLKKLVSQLGSVVQGFGVINTIPAKIVDKNGQQALPGKGREMSGVCGSAIKWAGLDMVQRMKNFRDEFGMKYQIVGVGGVMNVSDFFEYRRAGANVVMSATGAMWNPWLAKEVIEAV